jgi:hypothetical protein
MFKQVATGFPVRLDRKGVIRAVLLARRKRGIIGVGKFCAYGGEIELKNGENAHTALIREFYEESDMDCMPQDIEPTGELSITYQNTVLRRGEYLTIDVSQSFIHLNLIHGCIGTPKDSVEMTDAQWFSRCELPVASMLEGDAIILQRILSGNNIRATGIYDLTTGKIAMTDGRKNFLIRLEATRLSRPK